jgi:hypothetical protein
LVGNPKEETAYPQARKKTLMSLLQLALVGQQAESEAKDPNPEEGGISVRLVSLTARPRLKRARPLRASMVALVVPGMLALFESRWIQYAGEGLTVSKYAHRAVKLSSPAPAAMASSVMLPCLSHLGTKRSLRDVRVESASGGEPVLTIATADF